MLTFRAERPVCELGPDTRWDGRLVSKGDVALGGPFSGELQARGHVRVDPGAEVAATVRAASVSLRPGARYCGRIIVGGRGAGWQRWLGG